MKSNRITALVLALTPILLSSQSLANEATVATDDPVVALEQKLADKRSEISSHAQNLQTQRDKLDALLAERETLAKSAIDLEKKRNLAQERLDEQFRRLIENPDTDLTQYRDDYQVAWNAVKQNQSTTLTNDQAVAEQQRIVEGENRQKQLLMTSMDNLQEAKKEARVKRLRQELTVADTIEVVHTITCSESMTLAACANQGKTLTMQKAVNTFQSQVLDNVTESTTAKLNANRVSFNIHVMNNNVVDSGFSGTNRYITRMQAEMRSQPDENAACKLLDFAERYCVEKPFTSAKTAPKQQAKRWVNIKIRSNRYDDNVTINGVTYGSTPVEIMLPAGQHQVSVDKPGFESYSRQMYMNKDSVVWANLKEQENQPQPGKQFADKLTNNRQAPQMVVVGAGQYRVGFDAKQSVMVDQPYSIAATPVTVQQFGEFVTATGYVTNAEEGQGCTTLENGEPKQLLNHHWRKPGFSQTDSSPVVCITQEDAMAYSKWLSSQTGFNYTLPSEVQWEVAARAGRESDYWWGNDIGVGNANTGWSGSEWSNKSTSPVASFPANPFGIYDTAGNVWEWAESHTPVARGGAWSFSPSSARVAERLELKSDLSANYVGFRVVRQI
ncbi:SUMF1/EgtB/PvdO family nonheme iron enzyme [Enterovibrio sp. ZSDZ35]|uniref:SUMF1/EgtB/PvdO family nonheme iron enzyme n=1 Tax=Enterovibrio qingdaonensis TaxID=2899818 RepID=A0ABT5QK30_9GAMM|nr:SUMF1/EgtB/PvdO family nonheme iron enzyme [Enterovibrio sp. ZSDZ35]MDD1781219.1 SUMF1/EgtB/PvdO family nonheme iron enzyme [Enterovibrio sp. ZSDZ35]